MSRISYGYEYMPYNSVGVMWVMKFPSCKMNEQNTLGVAPSQDSSGHQDYYMFNRESL